MQYAKHYHTHSMFQDQQQTYFVKMLIITGCKYQPCHCSKSSQHISILHDYLYDTVIVYNVAFPTPFHLLHNIHEKLETSCYVHANLCTSYLKKL